jgi:hypothetical protein
MIIGGWPNFVGLVKAETNATCVPIFQPVTTDLIVPTFTRNVKVSQPRSSSRFGHHRRADMLARVTDAAPFAQRFQQARAAKSTKVSSTLAGVVGALSLGFPLVPGQPFRSGQRWRLRVSRTG